VNKRKIFRQLISIKDAEKLLEENFNIQFSYEVVDLTKAYQRILGEDIISPIDVPSFDRASMDGYAVIAEDTYGAREETPKTLKVIGVIKAGDTPNIEVHKGEAVEISTGAPIPKGANAVIMVEYTSRENDEVTLYRSVYPGENIMSTGTDIMCGELILRKGQVLTPREIGVLAAIGVDKVKVYTKPNVAILSTGNEIVPPRERLSYGKIYDVNTYSIAAAVEECGCNPLILGIGRDDELELERLLKNALNKADVIITSGSTSAGIGDIMYRLLNKLGKPGVIVHGIAIKPGKPTIIAVINNKIVFGLPGYPTSGLTIFNVFVRPVLCRLSGKPQSEPKCVKARIALKVHSTEGRRYLLPVSLVKIDQAYSAYPIFKGSGAITTLSNADGYIEIPETKKILEEGEEVEVKLFSDTLKPANLTIIGSHCMGVDILLSQLIQKTQELTPKVINAGSLGGLNALKRGEADIAGVHLLDETTGEYNIPFLRRYDLVNKVILVKGYVRRQGLIVQKNNPKQIRSLQDLLREDVTFINRNSGSGTRIFLEIELKKIASEKGLKFDAIKSRIRGFNIEDKTHSAVAAAVKNGKADVGIGIESAARYYDLDFIPLTNEEYDFAVLKTRLTNPYVKLFISQLKSKEFKEALVNKMPGLIPTENTGRILIE